MHWLTAAFCERYGLASFSEEGSTVKPCLQKVRLYLFQILFAQELCLNYYDRHNIFWRFYKYVSIRFIL